MPEAMPFSGLLLFKGKHVKTIRCLKAALLIAVALAATTGSAYAVGTLIPLSSGTFNGPANRSDWGRGVAIDAFGNILMTGMTDNGTNMDYLTVKFNPDFVLVSSATNSLDRDDQAYAVAADASGNIIVTGISASGGSNIRWLTIKYDPGLTVVSSATFTSPWGGTAWANDVAADSSGNIIVTGRCYNGTSSDAYTVKYSPDLQLLSSVSYNGPANGYEEGVGVAVDASDNIVVLCYINNGTGGGYFTTKYTPDLQIISSATYHVAGSAEDIPCDVAIDPSGNIIVTGRTLNATGYSAAVIKYDPDMKLLSSTQYPELYPNGVAADRFGNIIVTGYYDYDNGTKEDFVTLKFDPHLQLISSGRYNGPANSYDYAFGAVVDSSGHVVIGGSSNNGTNLDYYAIKYNGLPPVVSDCVPASATQGDTLDVVITGSNFLTGATALLSGPGITVNSLTLDSTSQVTANITLDINPSAGSRNVSVTNVDALSGSLAAGFLVLKKPAPVLASVLPVSGPLAGGTTVTLTGINFLSGAMVTVGGAAASNVTFVSSTTLTALTPPGVSWGAKDILVTNPDDQSSAIAGGFFYEPVRSTSTIIDPAAGGMAVIEPESGYIGVTIPAGTFGESVTLSVSTTVVPASQQAAIIVTNVGIEVSAGGQQPGKDITITVYYRDADITGLDESKLSLARYDNGRWIPIPTVVYADQNKLVGTIKHLSTFAVVQLAPATDLSGVKVFPNPFEPKQGWVTVSGLTGEAEIRIYNVAGELVRTLNYSTANGQAIWDGKNDGGNTVASGVYLALIKSSAGKKTVKIAVER